jgi:hypothetical protein
MCNQYRISSAGAQPVRQRLSEEVGGPQLIIAARYENHARPSFLDRDCGRGHFIGKAL